MPQKEVYQNPFLEYDSILEFLETYKNLVIKEIQ